MQESEPATTLDALETAGEQDVRRLKRFMSDALQRTIPGDIDTLASAAVAPERADHLAQALQDWSACAPLPLLALRMLIDDDKAQRARGAALLVQWINLAISLLPLLREDVWERLACPPSITVAGADCAHATAALTGAVDAQRHGADDQTDATTQPLHGEGRTIRCRCRCRLHRMMLPSTVKHGAL